jgi:predicted nucleic acid-binding protein
MNARRQLAIETFLFRAVFDTNVIIAALKSKNPNSPIIELLQRWRQEEFTLIYCDDLRAEYQEKFIDRSIDTPVWMLF